MEKTVSKEKVVAKKGSMSQTKQIAMDAMFVALTLIFTAFVNIQVPAFGGAGGLIHLGNVPLFLAAMLFGKRTGALAGGLGMGLFDLLSGWAAWAPCTIITCGLMGFTVGAICKKHNSMLVRVVAIVVALGIKIAGYFLFEGFIMENGAAAAIKSIPGNVVQVVMAGIIVLVVVKPLEKGLRVLNF